MLLIIVINIKQKILRITGLFVHEPAARYFAKPLSGPLKPLDDRGSGFDTAGALCDIVQKSIKCIDIMA
jgi:hypothetical protein